MLERTPRWRQRADQRPAGRLLHRPPKRLRPRCSRPLPKAPRPQQIDTSYETIRSVSPKGTPGQPGSNSW